MQRQSIPTVSEELPALYSWRSGLQSRLTDRKKHQVLRYYYVPRADAAIVLYRLSCSWAVIYSLLCSWHQLLLHDYFSEYHCIVLLNSCCHRQLVELFYRTRKLHTAAKCGLTGLAKCIHLYSGAVYSRTFEQDLGKPPESSNSQSPDRVNLNNIRDWKRVVKWTTNQ
jgi:hypothetical protein